MKVKTMLKLYDENYYKVYLKLKAKGENVNFRKREKIGSELENLKSEILNEIVKCSGLTIPIQCVLMNDKNILTHITNKLCNKNMELKLSLNLLEFHRYNGLDLPSYYKDNLSDLDEDEKSCVLECYRRRYNASSDDVMDLIHQSVEKIDEQAFLQIEEIRKNAKSKIKTLNQHKLIETISKCKDSQMILDLVREYANLDELDNKDFKLIESTLFTNEASVADMKSYSNFTQEFGCLSESFGVSLKESDEVRYNALYLSLFSEDEQFVYSVLKKYDEVEKDILEEIEPGLSVHDYLGVLAEKYPKYLIEYILEESEDLEEILNEMEIYSKLDDLDLEIMKKIERKIDFDNCSYKIISRFVNLAEVNNYNIEQLMLSLKFSKNIMNNLLYIKLFDEKDSSYIKTILDKYDKLDEVVCENIADGISVDTYVKELKDNYTDKTERNLFDEIKETISNLGFDNIEAVDSMIGSIAESDIITSKIGPDKIKSFVVKAVKQEAAKATVKEAAKAFKSTAEEKIKNIDAERMVDEAKDFCRVFSGILKK